MFNTDCKENGSQELPGEAPGSGGDSRFDVDDLLGQDGDAHAEPHDRRALVVRRTDLQRRYIKWSILEMVLL